LLLLLHIRLSHSLVIFKNNIPTFLPSYYSTLGTYPTTATTYQISVVESKQIENCDINPAESSAGSVQSNVLVLNGALPAFHPCGSDIHAAAITLAILAQQYGALAVILEQSDEVAHGRAIGFSTRVTIPVLVVPSVTIQLLLQNTTTLIQLPAVTSQEMNSIDFMVRLYKIWSITTMSLYGILVLVVIYSLTKEIMYVYFVRRKLFSHTCLMKLSALLAASISLLWAAVDPFGFKGIVSWQTNLVLDILKGSIIIVYLLIFRTWVKVLGIVNHSRFLKVTVSRLCYVSSAVILAFSIASGTLWYHTQVDYIYEIFSGVAVAGLGVGYAVVGKKMLDGLVQSKNVNNKVTRRIIFKIGGFIVFYGIAAGIGVFVVFIHITNHLFTEMICTLTHGFGLLITFFILYFRHSSTSQKRTPGKPPPTKALSNSSFVSPAISSAPSSLALSYCPSLSTPSSSPSPSPHTSTSNPRASSNSPLILTPSSLISSTPPIILPEIDDNIDEQVIEINVDDNPNE